MVSLNDIYKPWITERDRDEPSIIESKKNPTVARAHQEDRTDSRMMQVRGGKSFPQSLGGGLFWA
jgi:hypothetical protein